MIRGLATVWDGICRALVHDEEHCPHFILFGMYSHNFGTF